MEVNELKEKLHALIENSSEDTLEYMYSLFEDAEYSEEFRNALDKEYDVYQEDKGGDTRAVIDIMVKNLLNK